MSSPGTTFNNPIIQRVRRHRTMATLYRSAVADVAASPLPPASPVVAPERAPIPKATLLPAGSTLPEGRLFTVAEDMRPFSPAERRPVSQPRGALPVQTQRLQRQETPSSQVPDAPEVTARQPTVRPAPGPAEEQPSQDEGFEWISDKQWDDLKSFMEGHQEKLAREGTGQESAGIQRSPEEVTRQKAREKAQAELARRQEMARSGQLPRAKVEYVSEKKAPGESSPPTPGEGAQRSPQEPEDVQAEAQVDEAIVKTEPQEPVIDRSLPPVEPVPPTSADQTSGPTIVDIQRQEEGLTKEQRRSEGPQESEPIQPASSVPERPAGEEMDESPPSRPVEPDLELPKETSVGESPKEVAESAQRATMKPSTIQRQPTEKLPEVEPAGSQPATEIDDQVTLESTISPPEPPDEPEAPGLGRRLLDAARSLFGRKEETPEFERPAGELPASRPIEPRAQVQRESQAGPTDKMVQRHPVEEDLAEASPEIEGEESARSADIHQTQEPLEEEVVTQEGAGPEPTTEIPVQIQRDDRIVPRDAMKEGMAAEDEPQAETGLSPRGEVIARQEQPAPPKKPAKTEPESGISDDFGAPEPQEITDLTFESSLTPIDTVGDETLVQAAGRVPEAEIGVEDLHELAGETEKEGEKIPDFEVLEPAEDETTTQALPLQKAWPVQELHPPKDLPPSMTRPAESKKPGKTAQRKPAGEDDFAEEVHRATKDVSPGKPTDSSIELVTPRRPRPSQPPAPEPAPEVQRKPPESRQTDVAEPAPAEDKASEPLEKKPYLVPTEIGDLPSDLWQMLGEKPPQPQELKPPSEAQVDTTTTPVLQRMPETNGAPVQVAEMPSPLITQEFPIPLVQRAVSIRDVGTVTESEPEEAETAGEPEIDVDRLAREVFPEIKRRLKVEWERGRGRF